MGLFYMCFLMTVMARDLHHLKPVEVQTTMSDDIRDTPYKYCTSCGETFHESELVAQFDGDEPGCPYCCSTDIVTAVWD